MAQKGQGTPSAGVEPATSRLQYSRLLKFVKTRNWRTKEKQHAFIIRVATDELGSLSRSCRTILSFHLGWRLPPTVHMAPPGDADGFHVGMPPATPEPPPRLRLCPPMRLSSLLPGPCNAARLYQVRVEDILKDCLVHILSNLTVDAGHVQVFVIFNLHVDVLHGQQSREIRGEDDKEKLVQDEGQVDNVPHEAMEGFWTVGVLEINRMESNKHVFPYALAIHRVKKTGSPMAAAVEAAATMAVPMPPEVLNGLIGFPGCPAAPSLKVIARAVAPGGFALGRSG
ncbi:hypothetical protein C8R44DRAFT_727249 [Mycena epipterygia]|nr:hypothetical protein C8R44DRAFT_727249 [Mycena epipterygia]